MSPLVLLVLLTAATGGQGFDWFGLSDTAGSAKTPGKALEDGMEVLREGKGGLALKHFRRIAVKWPESPEAVMALHRMARIETRDDPEDAFENYQIMIDRHAGKFDFEEVLEAQMAIAARIQQQRSTASRFIPGLHNSKKAIPFYETIIGNAPSWDRSAEAQYLVGVIHQSNGDLPDAVAAYRKLLSNNPESEFAERAEFYQCECLHQIAMKKKKQRELDSAWVFINRFLENHPESDFTDKATAFKNEIYETLAQAAYDIALYYDHTVNRPDAALVAYRKFVTTYPGSKHIKTAVERIRELSHEP